MNRSQAQLKLAKATKHKDGMGLPALNLQVWTESNPIIMFMEREVATWPIVFGHNKVTWDRIRSDNITINGLLAIYSSLYDYILSKYSILEHRIECQPKCQNHYMLLFHDREVAALHYVIDNRGGIIRMSQMGMAMNAVYHDIKEKMKYLIEKHSEIQEGKTRITYSYLNNCGSAGSISRDIPSLKFDDIAFNYTRAVRCGIRDAISMESREDASLIIWTGKTGTGKTFALRSLLAEWEHSKALVVVDPESFIESSAAFLGMLLEKVEEDDDDYEEIRPHRSISGKDTILETTPDKRRLVIIMEDSPGFMLTESRSGMGDIVSKMLNVTSGLLNMGLNIKIIVTSNENIKEFDPAFTRPGRMLQQLEFVPFSAGEAEDWMRRMGESESADQSVLEYREKTMNSFLSARGEITLAELYAIVAGIDVTPKEEDHFGRHK